MDNAKYDESLNLAFLDILNAILNYHYKDKKSLSELTSEEKQKVFHRALIFLKAEILLFNDWKSIPNDDWVLLTKEKLVWHHLINNKNIDPIHAMRLNKVEMFYLIYPDAVAIPIPQEIKNNYMGEMAALPGFNVTNSLPWNLEEEWFPGVMLSSFQKLNSGNFEVSSVR